MGSSTDVLIIGGGPAGLAAAIAARSKGFEVTVADGAKPPIDKACGEGLMPATIGTLRELGVVILPGEAQVFRGIRFLDGTSSVEGKFPSVSGMGLLRTVLHEKLAARAQQCGVSLIWNTPVTNFTESGAILGGQCVTAKWIVGADGINSRVRRWAGLDSGSGQEVRFAQARHYRLRPWTDCMEIYWGRETQAYVTPVGDEEICVALISRNSRMRLEESGEEFPGLARRLKDAVVTRSDRGAITVTRRLNRVYDENIVLIGDASGSVDAITGEGLAQGFCQALALADAIEAGNLKSYQRAHRRMAWRPNLNGRLLLQLARYPFLRKRVMRALTDSELFSRLLASHLGESSALHSVTTSARLGWQLLAA